MKKFANSRSIAYYRDGEPKIVASLFLAFIAVLLVLVVDMDSADIAYSQIMPTNISDSTIDNKSLTTQM
ncbi:MAG: hypothetical protein ACRD5B_13820, partial [Nitrososphaeraceae archaeon]